MALFFAATIATNFVEGLVYQRAFAIFDVFMATIIVALVYMCWKNKTLMGIVVFGEFLMLSLALGTFTPKEAIKKAGDKIESVMDK